MTTAEEQHTETAMPQEIGTMTSDGSSPRVTRAFIPRVTNIDAQSYKHSPRGIRASQSYQSCNGGLTDHDMNVNPD